MDDRLSADAKALEPKLTEWRRALHRKPELGFEERWTSGFVAERLEEMGYEVERGVAQTGIVAKLSGKSKAAVMLRADMDALPIQEVEGRPYGSEHAGRMHACGHDGHMAMLLGAASLLKTREADLPRDVLLCFQPAEEARGGARAMIEDGVLDRADVREVYGLHLWSGFPVGEVHVRPGPIMAAQDEFTAVFHGQGGHGALPHTTIDPNLAAAQGLVALQSVVSRRIDPLHAAVVSVGRIAGGEAANVIPETTELVGTMRSFDPGVREQLRRDVRTVLAGIADAHGCRLAWELRKGYPAVVNEASATERARAVAERVVGAERVVTCAPMAAAEDFAYFLEQRPGAFMFVGVRNEERGITAPHHNPAFDLDESALPVGAELLARLAVG